VIIVMGASDAAADLLLGGGIAVTARVDEQLS
jgi:hypothetical protein